MGRTSLTASTEACTRSVSSPQYAQIIEYVTALQHGDAPAHLVEVSSRELVPPTDPFLSVVTIRRAANR